MEKPILVGNRVRLRPITVEDAPRMYEGIFDEESTRLTGTQGEFTLEQVTAFCEKVSKADDRVDYAITLLDDSDALYVGEVVLNQFDSDNNSAVFRIALMGKDYFGKGYGTEATRLIVQFGFETLKLNRIELEVYDFNPRAQHVYEKVGFVKEGVRREVLLWEGKYQNGIVMSMLASDYFK